MNNKWIRAALPAILIHISVGTVYCWSAFKQMVAEQIHMNTFSVGWAFSLAIFFLGISAAFAGRAVEKNIHKSSLIACMFFSAGMIGTGLILQYFTGVIALIGIYLFYGVIMGIGLGVGYLTPVKTLMLWFKDNKGLATGISIMGFGLAKAIATPIMNLLQDRVGISAMFLILGIVYFVIMFIGHLLLKKPDNWVEEDNNNRLSILTIFKNKQLLKIWLMFYINIHCGLMIISYEKQILSVVFAASASLITILNIVPSCTAAANALGRIGYSSLSDKFRCRIIIYDIIFISCISILAAMLITSKTCFNDIYAIHAIFLVASLVIINLGYGGGFSTLPALLSEKYGMKNISQLHGIVLTAWAVAGITGNNMTELILSQFNGTYYTVFIVTCVLYTIAKVICNYI